METREPPAARATSRSAGWFGLEGKNGFNHRSWMKNQGFPHDLFDGRPVIGICNSWSELTPCNAHLRRVAESVKRGVWEVGGFPLEFPTTSIGETLVRPTSMLLRNLMSMDVEESIRSNPLDGVVLLAGCDKTTPAQVMGAASVDLPAILVTGGPMLNGKFRGADIGSGTHVWKFSEDVRAGRMTQEDFIAAEGCMSRSNGHCMTMGTASTMACLTEALGLQLPGSAAIPAVDARRFVTAHEAGRRIVGMVGEDLRPSRILTRAAFENAIRVNAAIGGSTNAIVHLLAIAGRVGVPLDLDDFDRLVKDVPLLVNLMPSGDYLMEDFYYAGGLPAVIRELGDLMHRDALTVSGRSIGENTESAARHGDGVIGTLGDPVRGESGIAVLRGNLCPDGAVIKRSAASPHLLRHRGRALVWDTIEAFEAEIDDPDLDVDETTVLVVRNAGPRGYPGMPEIGNLALPRRLLERGVEDMVRISDARMSGTSYGTVVLHAAPEAAVGGPLALLRSGDVVALDVGSRTLDMEVPDAELARRRAQWRPPDPPADRGYLRLYTEHVLQADTGADFDFLLGSSGAQVPRVAF
jgi:dihydroxy-acid dehydratase